MRYEAAGLLAYLQYKDKDIQSALKTLEDTPSPIRPFAQTVFGTQFLLNNNPDYNFLIQIIDKARDGFIKSEEPFTKKSDYWFQLIKIYSNFKLQGEAAAVFKEIIKAYNNAASEDENNPNQINSAKISAVFSDSLLEAQDNVIFNTTQSINEIESRTNANFAFLKITLQKYERLNSQIEKTLVKQKK